MMKKSRISIIAILSSVLLFVVILFLSINAFAEQDSYANRFNLFVTGDIHSYFEPTYDIDLNGEIKEHGDASKAATIIKERRGSDSLYLDDGDFSMGTLIQTGFEKHAYELRLLGKMGCDVTTMGNHEFDLDTDGLANMLNSAIACKEKLPEIVQSNIILEDGSNLSKAFNNYNIKPYTIKEVNGVKVGIFGLEGLDSIDCMQTKNQQWINYIEAAKNTVAELKDKCDIIVCLSHSGTDSNGSNGEDVELLKAVPQINVCLSSHTHYNISPQKIGNSYLLSTGCYLETIGFLTMEKLSDGSWELANYENIHVAGDVAQDQEILDTITNYNKQIKLEYLDVYADGSSVDDVICQSDYTYENPTLYNKKTEEYPLQDLIADSYIYAAKLSGVNDIDVAINGLGTVRSSTLKGPLTVNDAFKVCSLGVGTDGSSGHALYAMYLSGSEIKLLTEIECSLGSSKEGMKFAYSGMKIEWNSNRIPMDKVLDIKFVKDDGGLEDIQDGKLYKVCTNGYSLNMLGSVCNLSKGLIKFTPKDQNGNEVQDFSSHAIKDRHGKDLKEWVAFKDYLQSLKVIPEKYSGPQGRKFNTNQTGLAIFSNPGSATWVVLCVSIVLFALIVLIVYKIIKKIRK